jgi:DeoR family transcriptional regulator of aga operon
MSQLLDRLLADGTLDVEELAKSFDVSCSTIRRDLSSLETQRLLVRTRGGAQTHSAFNDLPLRFKVGQMLDEKRRIARRARDLLGDARVVGMTGGTTTTEFARTLHDADDLTVVTNALNIAVDLLAARTLRVFIVGGEARNSSYESVGPTAEDQLGGYNIDLAVLGVDGIDLRAGCTVYDSLGSRTTTALARQARRTVVVADGSKIGKVAFATVFPLDQIDTLITDRSAPEGSLDAIRGVLPQLVVV